MQIKHQTLEKQLNSSSHKMFPIENIFCEKVLCWNKHNVDWVWHEPINQSPL